MANRLKKLFLSIGLCFIAISCGTGRYAPKSDAAIGLSMKNSYVMERATSAQLDSIIFVDKLPSMDCWLKSDFIDYETGSAVAKRMYIHRNEDGTEVVYIVQGSKEPLKITKRITE